MLTSEYEQRLFIGGVVDGMTMRVDVRLNDIFIPHKRPCSVSVKNCGRICDRHSVEQDHYRKMLLCGIEVYAISGMSPFLATIKLIENYRPNLSEKRTSAG